MATAAGKQIAVLQVTLWRIPPFKSIQYIIKFLITAMNKTYIAAILDITRLTFSSALENTMPIGTHKILRRNSQTDFIAKTKKNALFSGNANSMCLAMAKNTEKYEASAMNVHCRPLKKSACRSHSENSFYDLVPEINLQCNLSQKCFV